MATNNCEYTVNVKLDEKSEKIKSALLDAWTDIGEWQQLARRQREMMNQNLGWCPTQAGIDKSDKVKQAIGAAIKLLVIPKNEGNVDA